MENEGSLLWRPQSIQAYGILTVALPRDIVTTAIAFRAGEGHQEE